MTTPATERCTELLAWYRRLWTVAAERCDEEAEVTRVERRLGVSLPPLLRVMYLQTSLRDSQMIHLVSLEELAVDAGVLVFCREQQDCWRWGIELDRLAASDPPIVANVGGRWEADGCTLEELLRFYALTNRPFESPCASQVDHDEDRLAGSWTSHAIAWRSIQHTLWTNGEAVLEVVTGDLGARDSAALRRAAASLGIEEDELEPR